jgi:exonuclease 3'-5' domain-containing protein 1
LGANGSITLVQVASFQVQTSGLPVKVVIFDTFLNPDLLKGCLKKFFESDRVVKVIHDCRNDSAALYFQHGVTLNNAFDTQVAHSVIQQQNAGKPAYKSKFVSLNLLCELYGNGVIVNPKKESMKKNYRKDQKYWSRRPLNEDMIFYAASDVFALVPQVYMNMMKAVRHEYQPLLLEMNEEAILTGIKPDEVKATRKTRKIDMEVTDLKVKLFSSDKSVQIVLSNREIRLLRYIDLTDEVKSKIEGSQKVAKKLERLSKKQEEGCSPNNDCSDNDSDNESDEETPINDRSHSDDNCEEFPSLSSTQSQDMYNGNGHNNSFFSPCSDSLLSSRSCCSCSCHALNERIEEKNGREVRTCDAFAQTLSTGDVVITKVIFEENDG